MRHSTAFLIGGMFILCLSGYFYIDSFGMETIAHEQVHVQLCKLFGVDAKVRYDNVTIPIFGGAISIIVGGYTDCNETKYWALSESQRHELDKLHYEFHELDYPRYVYYSYTMLLIHLMSTIIFLGFFVWLRQREDFFIQQMEMKNGGWKK